jgi:hypothetical protein
MNSTVGSTNDYLASTVATRLIYEYGNPYPVYALPVYGHASRSPICRCRYCWQLNSTDDTLYCGHCGAPLLEVEEP